VTPERIIRRLSRRFGVSEDFGRRLRPLLERALESPPEARRRILDLVERSYAHQALIDQEEARLAGPPPPPDETALEAVARVLHGWSPPDWLVRWTEEGSAPS